MTASTASTPRLSEPIPCHSARRAERPAQLARRLYAADASVRLLINANTWLWQHWPLVRSVSRQIEE